MPKIARYLLSTIAIVVLAAGWWSSSTISTANKSIDEANAAIQAGNELALVAGPKIGDLLSEENLREFPGNRSKLLPIAQEVDALLMKCADQFQIASDKFKAASQSKVKQEIIDYWSLKEKQFLAFARSKQSYAKMALLIADETISEADQLNTRIIEIGEESRKHGVESEDFNTKSEKIMTDNPSSFEKS